jgi:hypothetical protein
MSEDTTDTCKPKMASNSCSPSMAGSDRQAEVVEVSYIWPPLATISGNLTVSESPRLEEMRSPLREHRSPCEYGYSVNID